MPAELNKCECGGVSDCGTFRHTDAKMINDFMACLAPPIPGAHKTQTLWGTEHFCHAALFM